MSEDTPRPSPLPEHSDLDWLRKQAKRRLGAMRATNAGAQLAEAQFDLAREYGFSSWRALKAHIDSLTIEGRAIAAARSGDAAALGAVLDAHPEALQSRSKPYGWTLLHEAAKGGHLAAVNLLLVRGLDVNARESGDNTCAMHWAAAAGHVTVVRQLADAGGDVIGHGDDHQLEVIGWATCWDGCDDDAHRQVVDVLLSRGARHHIFSAIAMNRADEVRRIVASHRAALNERMSRNENHRLPLQFAVMRNRPEMVALLLELGADPLAVDGSGASIASYATTPDADRAVMERIHALTAAELLSATRGHRPPRLTMIDLIAMAALRDWETLARLLREPELTAPGGPADGVLHLIAKRGDAAAVTWLVDHGVDPNRRWAHWDSDVTPMHLATLANHPDVVRALLAAGADPTVRDTKHDSDALGWAEFFGRPEIVELIKTRPAKT